MYIALLLAKCIYCTKYMCIAFMYMFILYVYIYMYNCICVYFNKRGQYFTLSGKIL